MHIKIAELLPLALEHKPSKELIHTRFAEAYSINKHTTIQILLYIRDKNNGAGRRDFTRVVLQWLRTNDEIVFNKILKDIVLIGRWDDLFFDRYILNDKVLEMIDYHLSNGNTLLKKWLPKENKDPVLARIIARGIGLTMKQYRLAVKKGTGVFINTIYRPIDSYSINIK